MLRLREAKWKMKDILVNAVCMKTWVAYVFSYAPAEIGQTQN